ncbi:MAG: hypothetical protein ACPG31_06945 [Planctomycetota bacterium]
MVHSKPQPMQMTSLMRVAWQCALMPLVAGVAIFLIWLITHWQLMMFLGGMTIAIGCLFTLVGLWALGSDITDGRRSNQPKVSGVRRNRALCFLVMLVNFPLALFMVVEGHDYYYSFPVTVVNESPYTLTDLVLGPGSKDCTLMELESGASEDFRQFDIPQTSFGLQVQLQGQPLYVEVDGYFIPEGNRNRATVIIRGIDDIEVQEDR